VYTPKRTVRRRFEIFDVIKANTVGMAALIIAAVLTAAYVLFPAFLMYFRPLEGKTGDPEGKRWDRSPGIVALLVFSAVLILAAGLAGPRLEQVFQTALGVR
jgi:formate hydrogenlyase subunit 3/multisubunit Na+/H+ antiporter MnhD subunit